jgi:hypothetical protein
MFNNRRRVSFFGVLLATSCSLPAAGQGLIYVDADHDSAGGGANANISSLSAFNTIANGVDDLWGIRTPNGAEGPSGQHLWESSGIPGGEDSLEISQKITGLTPGASYDFYAVYWSAIGQNWTIRTGMAPGVLTLYDRAGTTDGAAAGVLAYTAHWTTAPTVGGTPTFALADTRMLLGKAGTATANSAGQATVYFDDLPGTGSNNRTWFDGVAYIAAGTALPAFGDLNGVGGITLADYQILRDNLLTDLTTTDIAAAYRLGDMTADLDVDYVDFIAFRTAYDAVHGVGSLSAAIAQAPEPSGALLGLLAGGLSLSAMKVRARRAARRPRFSRVQISSRRRTPAVAGSMAVGLAILLAATAQAVDVTGWGLETGQTNGLLTEGAAGSFSIESVTGNASPRALLSSPFDFADAGDALRLTGTVTFANTLGNQQFRFGLFDNNGHATGTLSGGVWTDADPGGWLGYRAEIGNGGGGDFLKGRDPTSTGNYITNTGPYNLAYFGTPDSAAGNTPYDFELTLRRIDATSVSAEYVFRGGAISRSGFAVDVAGASTVMPSINAIGFLTNGNTGASQFSNVKVEAPKDLRLQVDPIDGQVRIVNQETIGFDVNYYEIRSTSGALNPTQWSSIDGDVPISETSWEKAGGSNDVVLAETNLFGVQSFAPGPPFSSASLGNAFDVGGAQDLEFFYSVGSPSTLAGDFDADGDVDGRDFLVWQRGGSPVPLSASDLADVTTNFGGAATMTFTLKRGVVIYESFALAAAQSAPEPATMALVGCAAALVCGRTRSSAQRYNWRCKCLAHPPLR